MDSDATVVLTFGKPDGGSRLTIELAKTHRKPCLHVDLNQPGEKGVARIIRWLKRGCPDECVLNIAGSRRSKAPGIHRVVKALVLGVLEKLVPREDRGPRRRVGKTRGKK